MKKVHTKNNRWLQSAYGQQFLAVEKSITDRAIKQISGPRVLQLGQIMDQQLIQQLDFPQWIVVSDSIALNQDEFSVEQQTEVRPTELQADAAFLPFEPDTFSSVLLPHTLEANPLPHQVLREAHRVLRSDGYLVLTGFNPNSLLGLQRLLSLNAAQKGNYYTLKRVKDWLQLLGFEVVAGAMYHYSPLSKSSKLGNALNIFNAVGDRWLPMLGGSYMICAKKRDLGMTLVGLDPLSKVTKRNKKLAPAPARKSAFEPTKR